MVLAAIKIVLVTKDADRHARPRDSRKLDTSRETLVPLRIVVFQPDLKLDGGNEVALLGLGVLQEVFGDMRNWPVDFLVLGLLSPCTFERTPATVIFDIMSPNRIFQFLGAQ